MPTPPEPSKPSSDRSARGSQVAKPTAPGQPFGASRDALWRQLAAELGADFKPGSWTRSPVVTATHGDWTLTLDTFSISTGKSTSVYTRLRAPYVNPDRFRFTIYRKGFFSDFAKWLGMEDVAVGHEPFDTEFIIKGTHRGQLRELFSNPKLRELLQAQPEVHFTVRDHEGFFGPAFPKDVDELQFVVGGVLRDLPRLKALFDLFAETLEQLCRIGSAYRQSPGFTL